MAKVSLNQAAKDTGVSLSTLSRWRKKGKITADKTDSGGYLIDTSEYDRITSMKKSSNKVQPLHEKGMLDIATPVQTPLLEQEIGFLKAQLQEQQATITKLEIDKDDYKERLDKSQSIVEKQTMLLSDLRKKTPEKPVEGNKKFLWWRRTGK